MKFKDIKVGQILEVVSPTVAWSVNVADGKMHRNVIRFVRSCHRRSYYDTFGPKIPKGTICKVVAIYKKEIFFAPAAFLARFQLPDGDVEIFVMSSDAGWFDVVINGVFIDRKTQPLFPDIKPWTDLIGAFGPGLSTDPGYPKDPRNLDLNFRRLCRFSTKCDNNVCQKVG